MYIITNIGVQELCWNNFGNNDGAKESRIIDAISSIIGIK